MKYNIRTLCVGAFGAAILTALSVQAAQPVRPGAVLPQRKVLSLSAAEAQGFDRFIVKYKSGAAARRNTTTMLSGLNAAAHSAVALTARAGVAMPSAPTFGRLRSLAVGADLVRASRRLNQQESDAFLAQLRSDPDVQYVQVDDFKHRLDVTPNDTQFSVLQWDFTDAVAGVRAPKAWDTSSGEGVVVAVLDTGYTDHRDLVANIVPGYDFVSYYGQTTEEGLYPDVAGDGDGRDADAHDPGDWTDASMTWCGKVEQSSWHGTHVAGTVAAVANNAQDIAGLAYGAKVQPVRVLGHCGGLTSDIVDGIIWASGGHVDGVPDNQNPAEVLNLSLGGSAKCSNDPATQDAINGAIARGVTVVVAAGNSNADAANYTPASCQGVITVGATGIQGQRSYFSNYGAPVTLSAPGGDATSGSDPINRWIWSTGNAGTTVPTTDVLMGFIGTSQATPHVAAAVAMMQSAAVAAGKPPLTPAQVKQVLRGTARPFPVPPSINTPMGAGILDAAAAVLAATEDVSNETAISLTNRVPKTGLTGATGDGLLYSITVPTGVSSLNLRTYGGTGDVSLYMSRDLIPTAAMHERESLHAGNSETIVVNNPVAGVYYLRVVGKAAFANVTVLGLYQ